MPITLVVLRFSGYTKVSTVHLKGQKFSSWGKKHTIRLKQGWEGPQGRRNFHCDEVDGIMPITE